MNASPLPEVFTYSATLTANRCNAQSELSTTSLVEDIIETATLHANALGIGYSCLVEHGLAWVLSRVAIQLKRYPTIMERYHIDTWIESYNRHLSERNFQIYTDDGSILGYVRTVWVGIDIRTRRPGNIEAVTADRRPIVDRPCPIDKPAKLSVGQQQQPIVTSHHIVSVSDIDFNRHINSARYVAMVLDQLTIADLDASLIGRLDVNFLAEGHFGSTLTLDTFSASPTIDNAESATVTRIAADDTPLALVRLQFVGREAYFQTKI